MIPRIRYIAIPGLGGGYTSPDMTIKPALIEGLDGYQFNGANFSWFKSMEKETQKMRASRLRNTPQPYMARGLQTQANPPAGLGTLKTMLTRKV